MLLESTSGRCCIFFFLVPVTVGKASPGSCNGKFLLDCPIHTRNSNLRVALLQSKQYSNNFQVSIKLPLLFLVVYAVQKLHVVMFPYWLHGQLEFDGSMLPLWSGTAFRLNLVESINSGHSSELWLIYRAATIPPKSLQAKKLPSS